MAPNETTILPGSYPVTSNADKSSLATTRRLLAALLNEHLLPFSLLEVITPTVDLRVLNNISTLFRVGFNPISNGKPLVSFYTRSIVREDDRVLYCDPEDVAVNLPILLNGAPVNHPVALFDAVAPYVSVATPATIGQARLELQSSVENQEMSFECVKEAPSLSSPSIAWEQSIIEGHPVHPMHRSRVGISLEESRKWTAEFQGKPDIFFIALPREQVGIHGNFHGLLGSWIPPPPCSGTVVIPIHEGQWRTITKLFPDAILLPNSKPSLALTSIRSVAPDDLPFHLKVALAVYTTSALRTISPYSVFNGPRVGIVAKALAPEPLKIIDEIASIGSNHPNPGTAKHIACIIRENPEITMPNYRHIVCASLVEKDKNGIPLVIISLGLHSQQQREEFLSKYVSLFLDCFIPPMLKGLGFEAHGQNTLARFDLDGNLVGFSIRDFGGLKIHLPTLKNNGLELSLMEGSSIIAETLEEVHRIVFHAGIQSNLHRMIRALDLHHNKKGWSMVQQHLFRLLQVTPLLEQWVQPTMHVKSLLTMKLSGLYNDFLYHGAPNELHRNQQGVFAACH